VASIKVTGLSSLHRRPVRGFPHQFEASPANAASSGATCRDSAEVPAIIRDSATKRPSRFSLIGELQREELAADERVRSSGWIEVLADSRNRSAAYGRSRATVTI